MKQFIPWLISACAVGFAFGVSMKAMRPAIGLSSTGVPETSTSLQAGNDSAAARPEGEVVHTFNDEDLRDFTILWQQRDLLKRRQLVLQDYWNSEQTRVATLNQKLKSDYGVETDKLTYLDGEGLVLRQSERPEPGPAGEPAPTPDLASGVIVRTFSDKTEMEPFQELWRIRDDGVLRMSVLRWYWNQEQQGLSQLGSRLEEGFNVKSDRDYALDGQRRALIELPKAADPEEPLVGEPAEEAEEAGAP